MPTKKRSKKTATKASPKLWAKAKSQAKRKMGKHSARAMMLAVKIYKKNGGKFKGKKSSSNTLRKWAKKNKK